MTAAERAETYLRLMAESELRRALAYPRPRAAGPVRACPRRCARRSASPARCSPRCSPRCGPRPGCPARCSRRCGRPHAPQPRRPGRRQPAGRPSRFSGGRCGPARRSGRSWPAAAASPSPRPRQAWTGSGWWPARWSQAGVARRGRRPGGARQPDGRAGHPRQPTPGRTYRPPGSAVMGAGLPLAAGEHTAPAPRRPRAGGAPRHGAAPRVWRGPRRGRPARPGPGPGPRGTHRGRAADRAGSRRPPPRAAAPGAAAVRRPRRDRRAWRPVPGRPHRPARPSAAGRWPSS